jgi:hypothetical protein
MKPKPLLDEAPKFQGVSTMHKKGSQLIPEFSYKAGKHQNLATMSSQGSRSSKAYF